MDESKRKPELGLLGLGLVCVAIVWLLVAPGSLPVVLLAVGACVLVYALFAGHVKLLG